MVRMIPIRKNKLENVCGIARATCPTTDYGQRGTGREKNPISPPTTDQTCYTRVADAKPKLLEIICWCLMFEKTVNSAIFKPRYPVCGIRRGEWRAKKCRGKIWAILTLHGHLTHLAVMQNGWICTSKPKRQKRIKKIQCHCPEFFSLLVAAEEQWLQWLPTTPSK